MKYRHGTHKSYVLGNCHCELCTKANRIAQELMQSARVVVDDEIHGSRKMYQSETDKCTACRYGNTQYMRIRRALQQGPTTQRQTTVPITVQTNDGISVTIDLDLTVLVSTYTSDAPAVQIKLTSYEWTTEKQDT